MPVGEVIRVDPHSGGLTRTVRVRPYVGFTKLDIVGVVVKAPRTDPRDAVLPPAPKARPTPTVTVTATPSAGASPSDEATPSDGATTAPSPSRS